MNENIKGVRPGLIFAMLTLLFGIGLGVSFGVNEDGFKEQIAQGVAAHPELHDANSKAKIWRYLQRAHFHAMGIGAFSLGLVILTAFTGLGERLKRVTSTLLGASGLYALGWFSMYLLAPSMGRGAAHEALVTKLLVFTGTGALLTGMIILFAHLLIGFGADEVSRTALKRAVA